MKPQLPSPIVVGLGLATLMASLDTSIANAGLPTLAQVFHATFPQVQWIVLAYLLAVTSLIVAVGRIGDIVGRRRMLLGGIAAFTAASVLCGLAPSLPVLITARALQGLGAATMLALSLAFVSESVPPGRVGATMGLIGTMSALGTAVGPSLGGFLIAEVGWRAIFLVNLPLGAFSYILVDRHLPKGGQLAPSSRPSVDFPGMFLLAGTLSLYSLSMSLGDGKMGAKNLLLLGLALLSALLFALVEQRSNHPLLNWQLFKPAALRTSLGLTAIVSTVVMSTLIVGPFYLSRALGLGAGSVGLVLSVGPTVVVVTGVLAGRAVDRFGTRRTSLVGLASILLGSVSLALSSPTQGIPGYVIPIAILTAGYAIFQAANNTAIMTNVAAADRGVVSGLLSLSRNLGLITGASAMGTIFRAAAGGSDLSHREPNAIAYGMHETFAVAAGLVAVALAAAIYEGLSRSRATRPRTQVAELPASRSATRHFH